ncbi:putative protease inhibitor [Thelonectria olida]|uniref:Protease inhibitor n=1 Tax=Thelonectria olida TaxID=1576542 RepID=A0A9P8W946_9HYPO|nr:putative protease inhibitor [Thelonectria olida]
MPSNHSVQQAIQLIERGPSKVLGLNVGPHNNVQPGQYIPKADAQSEPEISFPGLSPDTTYMVVGLDIDAPFPSFGVLGPVLHWIQPGFQVKAGDTLQATAPFICNFIGPAPPPVSSPHRYIFFLYEQPAGFDGSEYAPPNGQKVGVMGRMRYDLDAWAKQISLGPVLACNYYKSN